MVKTWMRGSSGVKKVSNDITKKNKFGACMKISIFYKIQVCVVVFGVFYWEILLK